MTNIPVKYIRLPKKQKQYSSMRRVAEQVVRNKLGKDGYIIIRGSNLDSFLSSSSLHYRPWQRTIFSQLSKQVGADMLVRICKYAAKYHGSPDYLVYHPAKCVFGVEVKWHHESIADHQLNMALQLQEWGVNCEIWRVMPHNNKIREKKMDLLAFADGSDKRESTEKVAYERSVSVYGRK